MRREWSRSHPGQGAAAGGALHVDPRGGCGRRLRRVRGHGGIGDWRTGGGLRGGPTVGGEGLEGMPFCV